MKTKNLTIQLLGRPGSGKSTMAAAIHAFLLSQGIVAPLVDMDFKIDASHQKERMNSIKENCNVTIQTVQLNRQSQNTTKTYETH